MPYEYRDDIPHVDEAFHVWARDLNDLFRDAWKALQEVLTDAGECPSAEPEVQENPRPAPEPQLQQDLRLHDRELDLLLVRFLQEALFLKDARQAIYRVDQIAVRQTADGWQLDARLSGHALEPGGGAGGSDVKAVTLDQLRVTRGESGWEATVVLDL